MNELKPLLEKIKSYNPAADLDLVERAYKFSKEAHKDHTRLSGDPYIIHPLAVATIIAELEQDVFTIASALLHDVVEDADYTKEDIDKKFGPEVAKMVEGVTKLSQLSFINREVHQAENFRKMFIAMGEDFRIIIIKLADRLHNMRTLKFLPESRQQATALETREIFAPLAHRLGVWKIKWELEDLSFSYLERDKYQELKQKVAESRGKREVYIQDFILQASELLKKVSITAEINGRAKHFYSIYHKMVDQNLEFEEIYDLTAVRIVVETIKDCYAVLGVVHADWKPIPGRFKDYIAMPKSNGYQSLHTTLIGPSGRPVEIQIRTSEMHRTAEYGIAAHWRYKEGTTSSGLDEKMTWFRQMLEWQDELKDAKDFMESLKIDLFTDEVFVFTPKGDVFGLPNGATPIDFAYRVHTEVGHRSTGAKVNGKIVPLD
ncbi:MAG: RelA/SpoT family protein, partial [bacterium]